MSEWWRWRNCLLSARIGAAGRRMPGGEKCSKMGACEALAVAAPLQGAGKLARAYHEREGAWAGPRRGWCWALPLLCGLLAAAPAARAEISASTLEEGVSRTVLGILGYTRWPQEGPVLRLCVVGEAEYARGLLDGKGLVVGSRPLEVRRADAQQAGTQVECDAIYAGRLAESAWRQLMRRLDGHPTLTISEHGALCRIGAMFCLKPARGAIGFEVNLDSVARSGVRVNPRVLQLARQGSEP